MVTLIMGGVKKKQVSRIFEPSEVFPFALALVMVELADVFVENIRERYLPSSPRRAPVDLIESSDENESSSNYSCYW